MKLLFNKKSIPDVFTNVVSSRRELSYLKNSRSDTQRKVIDRRGIEDAEKKKDKSKNLDSEILKNGLRYVANFPVELHFQKSTGSSGSLILNCINISNVGILLKAETLDDVFKFSDLKSVNLKFKIPKGTMPEGYEYNIDLNAKISRKNGTEIAFTFDKTLSNYINQNKGILILGVSSLFLFLIVLSILAMRMESFYFLKFNKFVYIYSITTATFLLTRYFFGAMYRPVKINYDFTPGVTIVIPCFNEAEWIDRTIKSCINQNYPVDKLEVIVVDDYSTDDSLKIIIETINRINNSRSTNNVIPDLSYIELEKNMGKREALARATLKAKFEMITFVDSDSFLDPFAIINLVQPFQDPKVAGVSGRTDVANTYTNFLTKMQSVRYYISFRIIKAAESIFDTVTCLSGPLACYRKEIVLKNLDAWLGQKFLGQRATFGDDRSLTNLVLRNHRTVYQDTAVCSTVVPNSSVVFLKQQMRWKRSWLRESLNTAKFMWTKEPVSSLFFYIGLVIPIAAPIVVFYNLIYFPVVHGVLPTTFIFGIILMAFLMSFVQLFLRKSTTWLYGALFCLYYELILIWQMPIACATFWKSTWGTRMTPEDISALDKKNKKKVIKA